MTTAEVPVTELFNGSSETYGDYIRVLYSLWIHAVKLRYS